MKSTFQLVYISLASVRFAQRDLMDLLAQSRRFNLKHEITGLLIYVNGHFMQLLEGNKKEIELLMKRIEKDARHHDVDVIERGFTERRHFPEWSMAFLDFASPQVRALSGYSTFLDGPFDAKEITNATTRAVDALHYFKAVMLASDAGILGLAQTVEPTREEA